MNWEEEADAAELGLIRMFLRHRITSLASCSCQFPRHWGLFCRHQFHIAVVRQIDALPSGVISPSWELLDGDASQARLMELLARQRPTAAAAGGSEHSLTKAERYAAALAAAKPLAELASTSDAIRSSVVTSLSALTMKERRNAAGGAAALPAGRMRGGKGSKSLPLASLRLRLRQRQRRCLRQRQRRRLHLRLRRWSRMVRAKR